MADQEVNPNARIHKVLIHRVHLVTAYLCTVRVVVLVLHYIHALGRADKIPPVHWVAGIGTLCVLYATYEMRRWGRFALLALSTLFLVDNVLGLLRLASLPRTILASIVDDDTFVEIWLGASGSSWIIHGLRFLLAAFSVWWLSRPYVAAAFESGKYRIPRASQVAIASMFATLAATNLYLCGTAQAVFRMLSGLPR